MNQLRLLGLLGGLLLTGGRLAHAQTTDPPRWAAPAPGLPTDSLTGRFRLMAVLAAPGLSAAELQARTREWLALNFEDAHAVIQLDDPGRGVLIGRASDEVRVLGPRRNLVATHRVSFTFRLDFQAGRLRYEILDAGLLTRPNDYPRLMSENLTLYELNEAAYNALEWANSRQATLAASTRQSLLAPPVGAGARPAPPPAKLNQPWAAFAAELTRELRALFGGLGQYVTTPPPRW